MTANRFNFRCWDKRNQHMFYDGYNCWEDTHITTHDYLGLSLGGDIYRQWEYVDNAPELANLTEEATDEYILMQSTGLEDKNCKEIYEGDIIRYKDTIRFINYNLQLGRLVASYINDINDYCDFNREWISNYEIIGNIYENKDILGE